MKMNIDHFIPLEKAWLARAKGFSPYPRQEVFLTRLGLSESEYLLLRIIKDAVADWDTRHAKYELFIFDPRQIRFYTGWSVDKAYKNFRLLRLKGFVILEDKKQKLYRVVELGLFKSMRDFKTLEEHELNYLSVYMQKLVDKVQQNDAKVPTELLNLQIEANKFLTGKEDSVGKSSFSSKSRNDLNAGRRWIVGDEDISPEEVNRLLSDE